MTNLDWKRAAGALRELPIRDALTPTTLWPLIGCVAIGILVALGWTSSIDRQLVATVQSVRDCRLVEITNWAAPPLSFEATFLYCAIVSIWMARAGAGARALVPWVVFASAPIELASKLLVPQAHVPPLSWPSSVGCPVNYGLIDIRTPNTFPSGHAIRTAYVAVLAGLYLRHRVSTWPLWWAVIGATTLVMAWARLYRSAHWPSDVLAGTLLGLSLALIAWRLLRLTDPSRSGGDDSSPAATASPPSLRLNTRPQRSRT